MSSSTIPILRWGEPYTSLETERLAIGPEGQEYVEVSQANPGLIQRDLEQSEAAWRSLQNLRVSRLLEILAEAAELFLHADLPLGEALQSPQEYVAQLSSTSGLPWTLCRENMVKIAHVCRSMGSILTGLTRGVDPAVLDEGQAGANGSWLSFRRQAKTLGVLLPSNSPGVNTLWLPAIALKTAVVLKPGRQDPWTPYRLAQALLGAGLPSSALAYYPTGHEGGVRILERCARSLLFGGGATVAPWEGRASVQIHGPGRAKILLGPDRIERWPDYLDLIVDSVARNGGRSCINASTVLVPSRADELADALAERLAAIEPRAAENPSAQLAAFPVREVAEAIDRQIERALADHAARDITRIRSPGPRLVESNGGCYLLPTVIRCADPDDPLANTEYLFPFVAVVEAPAEELAERARPSLVVSAITDDEVIQQQLLHAPDIDRINLGPIPTNAVQWDQPHEGNLFEFLFQRRAFQVAKAP